MQMHWQRRKLQQQMLLLSFPQVWCQPSLVSLLHLQMQQQQQQALASAYSLRQSGTLQMRTIQT
jgi:hypothetical protein